MITEKFIELAKQFESDDSIFGLFYKIENGQEFLGINGGDWMDEETYGPINKWCEINNVEPEYEAECDDDYFLEKGLEIIPDVNNKTSIDCLQEELLQLDIKREELIKLISEFQK